MTAETHPDPFQDAMGHGLQRAVQIASCAVTAAQVYVYQQRPRPGHRRTRRTARRALTAQIRADTRRRPRRLGTRPRPRLAAPGRPVPDRPRLGRGHALRRPQGPLVRARRRDRHAQMRRTPPRPAPLRHGPLRPAAQRRHRPSRRHARSRAAVRPPSPGPRHATTHPAGTATPGPART